jgi:hypothetical protein
MAWIKASARMDTRQGFSGSFSVVLRTSSTIVIVSDIVSGLDDILLGKGDKVDASEIVQLFQHPDGHHDQFGTLTPCLRKLVQLLRSS